MRTWLTMSMTMALLTSCLPEDPAAAAALKGHEGAWVAGEGLLRGEAMNTAAEAVRLRRPEYSVEEIKTFFADLQDVEYTSLRIEGARFVFSRGATVLCDGQYRLSAVDSGVTRDLELLGTAFGSCGAYRRLSVQPTEGEGAHRHFHMTHGTESGPQRAAPWSPSLWPTSLTAAQFSEQAQNAVPFFSTALPPK